MSPITEPVRRFCWPFLFALPMYMIGAAMAGIVIWWHDACDEPAPDTFAEWHNPEDDW